MTRTHTHKTKNIVAHNAEVVHIVGDLEGVLGELESTHHALQTPTMDATLGLPLMSDHDLMCLELREELGQ